MSDTYKIACAACAALEVKDDALANLTRAMDQRTRAHPTAAPVAAMLVQRAEAQVQRATDLLDLVGPHTCDLLNKDPA